MKANRLRGSVMRIVVLVAAVVLAAGCSRGPKDDLIIANVQKMAAVDRSLGFTVQIDNVQVVDRSVRGDRAVVAARISGWATHPEVHIGAILPAEPAPRASWAEWEFILRKSKPDWVIEDKFKTAEGFSDEP